MHARRADNRRRSRCCDFDALDAHLAACVRVLCAPSLAFPRSSGAEQQVWQPHLTPRKPLTWVLMCVYACVRVYVFPLTSGRQSLRH